MERIRLLNNTQYQHSITKAYFWYYKGEFITLNEHSKEIECYTEDEMGNNINYLISVENDLILDKEEDAETIWGLPSSKTED